MTDYQIFISYRWSNNSELAGRIYERLTFKDGFTVFLDEESHIHHIDEIKKHISKCKVFLLILGVGSCDRFTNPNDILYNEIKQAIEEKKHIIVVQTQDFEMPKTLPSDISYILELIRLRHSRGKFSQLYSEILKSIPIKPQRSKQKLNSVLTKIIATLTIVGIAVPFVIYNFETINPLSNTDTNSNDKITEITTISSNDNNYTQETIQITTIPLYGIGKITYDSVNVRSSPNKDNDDNIIFVLYKNDVFNIISFDGYWYKIEYNGDIGYVSYKMIELSYENMATS